MLAVGFDLDFAPVVDVDTNPANPVIGDRAFSRSADVCGRACRTICEHHDRARPVPGARRAAAGDDLEREQRERR